MKRRLVVGILLASFIGGTLLRGFDLLASYENGHRGACLAFFALMAKNHLRYGLSETGGVGVLNPDKVEPEYFNYYLHHPPGAILLATLAAYEAGTKPAGLRLAFLPLSVGIVFLLWRLARPLGRLAATAAAAIAALAPIGVYYGAFVNFEIPTLFFMILELARFQRFVNRGRPGDRLIAILAQIAAVFCDWIALGLPLALLVLLPFRTRRGADRAGRVRPIANALAMLVASGVVVVFVQAWYALQLHRYGRSADGGGYYLDVTMLAKSFRFSEFLARQGEYLTNLFGWPFLALTVAGVGLLFRCRQRGGIDRTSLAAIALSVVGVGNQVILANNATGHDYYLLYLFPGAALIASMPFSAATRSRTQISRLAAPALVVLCGLLTANSVRVIGERREFAQSEFGKQIGDTTEPGSVVLQPYNFLLQVPVAADRFVYHASDLKSFEDAKRFAVQFGMGGRPLVYLVGTEKESTLDPELRGYLARRGNRSIKGPFVVFELGPLTL